MKRLLNSFKLLIIRSPAHLLRPEYLRFPNRELLPNTELVNN